ncbi:hypothetical protein E2C01_004912 [Portunus trituberculatus]|uniref:Uncharacterized protein n=1 Tax=Portunus trituberculatus TaxID=210409 RepID=A0A5B7CXQ1_PORTR|nr:hypothetical protein [Portunus trituberculatus]
MPHKSYTTSAVKLHTGMQLEHHLHLEISQAFTNEFKHPPPTPIRHPRSCLTWRTTNNLQPSLPSKASPNQATPVDPRTLHIDNTTHKVSDIYTSPVTPLPQPLDARFLPRLASSTLNPAPPCPARRSPVLDLPCRRRSRRRRRLLHALDLLARPCSNHHRHRPDGGQV